MTLSSINAYQKSKEKRISNKRLILDYMKKHKDKKFSYVDLAFCLQISISNAQKRTSDLFKEGKISVVGQRNDHSLYQYKITNKKLTKPKAFEQAINEFCPDKLQSILNRVKQLV